MMSESENTSRRSSVRGGFVYGLTDANWFGVVLNSPTEWSTPEMHFPDVSQPEEYDPQATLDDFSRTVATLVDETEDLVSFKLNSPPYPRLTKQQQQRAQLVDGRRIPVLTHSTSSSSGPLTPHSISGQVAGTTRGRNPAVHCAHNTPVQDSKVLGWLEGVSSKK